MPLREEEEEDDEEEEAFVWTLGLRGNSLLMQWRSRGLI